MKIHKCPLCKKKYTEKFALYDHMEVEHPADLNGLPPSQIYFNLRNRYPLYKGNGKCVMTGKPTKFNTTTERYERFFDEKAKEKYREEFKKRMYKVHGKETLLKDPEHQKKMLKNRKISGEYTWSDGKTKFDYTGTYEKDFLNFLDKQLDWENPNDIMAPGPTFIYKHKGEKHFYIPDFYISSLDLIIEIKASDNKHYRQRDIGMERAKDSAMEETKHRYLKVMDKKYNNFMNLLEDIKQQG